MQAVRKLATAALDARRGLDISGSFRKSGQFA